MSRACQVVRVFTRGDVGGNHLGVVEDIEGLDTAAMQRIAADLGFSETTFVDTTDPLSPFVRIFTPGDELPFAGHPLVGSAWVLTVRGESSATSLRCGIGTVGIRRKGEVVWVDAPMSGTVAPADDVPGFLAGAGIPNVVSAARVLLPFEYLIGEMDTAATVAGLEPDFGVLGAVFGTLVYARDGDAVRARFFAPRTSVPEDPATGSAAVALATLLTHRGETTGRVTVSQGEEMGHPSTIELLWSADTASIGGTVRYDETRSLQEAR